MTHAGTCPDCGKPMMVMKNLGTGVAVHGDVAGAPPGMAMIGEGAPGTGPEAIGMYSPPGIASTAGMPAPNGMRGPRDEAVMQSTMASPPLQPHVHNRPHVISHMFNLDEIGKRSRERPDKKKQAHAAISYGPTNQPVTELPAKMVYGK
jgi:hypothetical protein